MLCSEIERVRVSYNARRLLCLPCGYESQHFHSLYGWCWEVGAQELDRGRRTLLTRYGCTEELAKIHRLKHFNIYLLDYLLTSFLSLYQAAVAVEISILLISSCSCDLFCPLLEKDNYIEHLYIALSCPSK